MLRTNLATRTVPFRYEPLEQYELNTCYINGKRHYQVGTDLFPSVTTVLSSIEKPGLEEWKKRVGAEEANKIMNQATRRGTAAHKLWEDYLKNYPNFSSGAIPTTIQLFKQLQPWLDRNIDFLYGNEIALFSRTLKTAGRCDAVGSVNNRPAIIDFKTSSKKKNEEWIENYFLQVACYAIMFEEMYGIVVEDAYILIAVEEDRPQSFPIKTVKYKDKVRDIFADYHKRVALN